MQLRKDTLIRQKEIVLAARKLIVKYGSENVTIKKMAQEIGVTEGAIYRHFKSKKDILSFLIDDIEEILIGDIEKNYSGEVGSVASLAKIMTGHINSIEQRRGVTFQVIAEIISFGDEELNNKVYAVINNYIAYIKDVLAEGIKNGVIKPDTDIDAVAKLYFGMTQGMVNIWALSKYRFNLEKEYQPLWEVFIKSIKIP
jgi:AcrR family transcriptional regulator